MLCLALLVLFSSDAFAWGWQRSLPPSHNVIMFRGARYHYWGGRFYRPGPFGYFVVNPPIGVIVTVLPPVYKTVIIGGVSYYYADDTYYTDSVGGYVVVPPPAQNVTIVNNAPAATNTAPVVTNAAPATTTETFPGKAITISVPNANGSFTPVKLVKYKGGYIGPQGEYYAGHPTVDQLSVLYGK